MTVVLELYDVTDTVTDVKSLSRSVRELLGNRAIATFVMPIGNSARIAVIRDDEIPLDVADELRKGGINVRFILKSDVLGLSESSEFVREVYRAREKLGIAGVASILGDLSVDKIVEKAGQVLPLEDIMRLKEAKENITLSITPSDKIPEKAKLIQADGSESYFDPDDVLDKLAISGVGTKIGKKVLQLMSSLLDKDFYIDYEVLRAIKRALAEIGDYEDYKAFEGFEEFASRVYIDGNLYSSAKLMEIIRASLKFDLEPSATLLRQLRDHIVRIIRHMAAESNTTLHFNSERISTTVLSILLAQMPYLSSKEPRNEAYFEAKREFMISKHLLEVDRGEAIKMLESAIEHALRAIVMASGYIPPFGIWKIIALIKDELNESLIKRLRVLIKLKAPHNRYNRRLINTVLEAAEELLNIAFEKISSVSSYERNPEDTLSQMWILGAR